MLTSDKQTLQSGKRSSVPNYLTTDNTRAAAEAAMETFAEKYGAKYEKAVTCLTKDRDALLAFSDS